VRELFLEGKFGFEREISEVFRTEASMNQLFYRARGEHNGIPTVRGGARSAGDGAT
jgi:hypothetical protein